MEARAGWLWLLPARLERRALTFQVEGWMFASLLHDWFGWPDGAVLTNLVASLIWGAFAWRKLHRMHREQTAHHVEMQKHYGIGGEDE